MIKLILLSIYLANLALCDNEYDQNLINKGHSNKNSE